MRSLASILAIAGACIAMTAEAATPALETPPPADYVDRLVGRGGADDPTLAAPKDLTGKEYTVNTKGNGPFFAGGSCPSAGFLGAKVWRARVVFEKTFSGRIVYTGTGQQCVTFGEGRVEYEDGSVYEGRVSWLNNSTFNGLANFEPALPRGPGRFTFPDGMAVEGEWERGELVGPVTITRPGAAPLSGVVITLAALRAGAVPAAPVAATPGAAPAAAAGAAPFDAAGTPFVPAGFAAAGAATGAATGAGKSGPQPMLGSAGKYLCPFTEDGTVAVWVDKAIKARMGGAIGGMVGAEAGKKVFENIPMFGGMFGQKLGESAGREIAIKAAGGWEYIKANSDQSFDDVDDFVTWMRANYAGTEHYADVVAAIKELYPELKTMQF